MNTEKLKRTEEVDRWITERRFANLYCDKRYLLDVLRGHVGDSAYAYLPTAETMGIPNDAYLMDVCHDWNCDCLWVRIAHGSFEPVPVGALPPNLSADRFRVLVRLKKVPYTMDLHGEQPSAFRNGVVSHEIVYDEETHKPLFVKYTTTYDPGDETKETWRDRPPLL